MSLVVIFFLPLGGIFLRLGSGKHIVKLHIAWQLTGLSVLLAGFGLGLWIQKESFVVFTDPHEFLGTVNVALFLLQPFLGAINHYYFRKTGVKTVLGYAHVWLGRVLLILGLVCGGLGIRLADELNPGKIAYSVFAGIAGLVYFVMLGWWYFGRKATKKSEPGQEETGEMAARVD